MQINFLQNADSNVEHPQNKNNQKFKQISSKKQQESEFKKLSDTASILNLFNDKNQINAKELRKVNMNEIVRNIDTMLNSHHNNYNVAQVNVNTKLQIDNQVSAQQAYIVNQNNNINIENKKVSSQQKQKQIQIKAKKIQQNKLQDNNGLDFKQTMEFVIKQSSEKLEEMGLRRRDKINECDHQNSDTVKLNITKLDETQANMGCNVNGVFVVHSNNNMIIEAQIRRDGEAYSRLKQILKGLSAVDKVTSSSYKSNGMETEGDSLILDNNNLMEDDKFNRNRDRSRKEQIQQKEVWLEYAECEKQEKIEFTQEQQLAEEREKRRQKSLNSTQLKNLILNQTSAGLNNSLQQAQGQQQQSQNSNNSASFHYNNVKMEKNITKILKKYKGLYIFLTKFIQFIMQDSSFQMTYFRDKTLYFGEYDNTHMQEIYGQRRRSLLQQRNQQMLNSNSQNNSFLTSNSGQIQKKDLNNHQQGLNAQMRRKALQEQEQEKKIENQKLEKRLLEYNFDFFDLRGYTSKIESVGTKVGGMQESPELGEVTFAGIMEKQRPQRKTMHPKWLVIRGFNFYWYETSEDSKAKSLNVLPFSKISQVKGNKLFTFIQPINKKVFTFSLSKAGCMVRKLLMNQIAFKNYYHFLDQHGSAFGNQNQSGQNQSTVNSNGSQNENNYSMAMRIPSPKMIAYFQNENCTVLDTSELSFDYTQSELKEKAYNQLFEHIAASLQFHRNVKHFKLSNSHINLSILNSIFLSSSTIKDLPQHQLTCYAQRVNKIEILDLSNNHLQSDDLEPLFRYLASQEFFSPNLAQLILNNNDLQDSGVLPLFKALQKRSKLLQVLDLEKVKMSDKGLFALIGMFEFFQQEEMVSIKGNSSIPAQLAAQQLQDENEHKMDLNISHNLLTEPAIKQLFNLMNRYQCINSIKLAHLKKLKPNLLQKLLTSLNNNRSLEKIDYTNNEIDTESLRCLFNFVEHHHVLKTINITIPHYFQDMLLYYSKPIYRYFLIHNIS